MPNQRQNRRIHPHITPPGTSKRAMLSAAT